MMYSSSMVELGSVKAKVEGSSPSCTAIGQAKNSDYKFVEGTLVDQPRLSPIPSRTL